MTRSTIRACFVTPLRALWLSLAFGSFLFPAPGVAAPLRVAILGDSISAGSGVAGGSPNWVAQLNGTGNFAFLNSAQGGATSATVVSQQLGTVKSQVQTHQVDYAVLMIGGNDAVNAALSIGKGGSPTSFINSYVNNVKTVFTQLAGAGPVHQIFGNMPDVTVTPLVQTLLAQQGVGPVGIQAIKNAIDAANAQADAYALSHGIPVLDMNKAVRVLAPAVPVTLAGQTFTTVFDTQDNFHPAPWVQGLLGNMVVAALDAGFGQSVLEMTDQKIVMNVGLPASGPMKTYDVTPFVTVPEPSSVVLLGFAVVGLFTIGRLASAGALKS